LSGPWLTARGAVVIGRTRWTAADQASLLVAAGAAATKFAARGTDAVARSTHALGNARLGLAGATVVVDAAGATTTSHQIRRDARLAVANCAVGTDTVAVDARLVGAARPAIRGTVTRVV
jgi:hypothetical protein